MDIRWCDEYARPCPVTGGVANDVGELAALPARMQGARNGFVSVQFLAGPVAAHETVLIEAADLTTEDGNVLAASAADIFVEWYHVFGDQAYAEVPVPQALVGGSTPEFRKSNGVTQQCHVGFWIDVTIPKTLPPGVYRGEWVLRHGNSKTAIPMAIDVCQAVIPDEPCLDVSMNDYADGISNGWADLRNDANHLKTARYRRIERGVFRAAHDHRAFIHYMPYGHSGYVGPAFAPPLAGEGPNKHVTSWTAWDRHFGGYFDGSAFKGTRRGAVPVRRFYLPLNLDWPGDFLKFGKPGYMAEWRAVGAQMVEHFKQKQWTGTSFDMFPNHKQRYRYFPWDAEEVRFIEDNDLHRYLRTLWEGTFDAETTKPVRFSYTLGSTWTYHLDIRSDLVEFVDVFIANTSGTAWDGALTPKLKARGCHAWACTSSGDIPTSLRCPAFVPLLMWMRGLSGYMPRWSSLQGWSQDPYRTPPDHGGGTLLYPGELFNSEESFASLRLKVQRNMLQTVDLLDSVARIKGRTAVEGRVNAVLGARKAHWFARRPKEFSGEPKNWVDAGFATEEPPLAGWEQYPVESYRELRALGLKLASGG
jgi:hypothetical protein